jgi:hypothetical protein
VIRYRIRIDVEFSGGVSRLGQIRTVAPNSEGVPSRVVAICCCPGVIAWRAKATPVAPYNASDVGGTLKVDGWETGVALPGVVPLDGSLLEAGGPDAGIWNKASGTGPGVATIPAGARVDEISAVANSVGTATIAIVSAELGALPVVDVSANSGFSTPPKNLIGPGSVTFGANTLEWFVSWREVL